MPVHQTCSGDAAHGKSKKFGNSGQLVETATRTWTNGEKRAGATLDQDTEFAELPPFSVLAGWLEHVDVENSSNSIHNFRCILCGISELLALIPTRLPLDTGLSSRREVVNHLKDLCQVVCMLHGCVTHVSSMKSTIVKPLLAQVFCVANQFACVSCRLLQQAVVVTFQFRKRRTTGY